jgi:hypothetical protein
LGLYVLRESGEYTCIAPHNDVTSHPVLRAPTWSWTLDRTGKTKRVSAENRARRNHTVRYMCIQRTPATYTKI